MNDSDEQLTPHDQVLVKLALLAHTGKHKAKGDKPTSEELAMLIDGQLDYKRKEEVMSHINADPALFSQWTQLVDIVNIENKQTVKFKEKTRWLAWLTNWQTLAGSVAVAGIATVLIMHSPTEFSPNIDSQPQVATTQAKGQTNTAQFVSPDKRAIMAGIKNSLKQKKAELGFKLNLTNAVDEQGSSLTPELYQNYYQLGQTITEMALQCKENQVTSPILLNTLRKLNDTLKRDSYIPLKESLADISRETEKKQRCLKINDFLQSEL